MISAEQFRFFVDLVKSTSGISLSRGKEYLIESRLNELARSLGMRGLDELYRKAKTHMTSSLKEEIVEAMTTNETYFFRDIHPFEALKKHVIPEISAQKKDKLDIWSAACSTGQEPYSIAILLAEHFPALINGRAKILATDISKKAVKKGAEGRFTQVEVNRGLPVTILVKYFKQQGAFWIVDGKPKKIINFRQMNLLSPMVGLAHFDIIFCRYVLIYFDQETKKQILQKLVKSLNPGGYLFLGATETPMTLPPGIKKQKFGRAICWKKT